MLSRIPKQVLLLFILFGLAVSGNAQNPPGGQPKIGKVSGHVLDATTNEPVEYAIVTLKRTRDSLVMGGVTDEKGWFTVQDMPPGSWKMKITFAGFKPYFDSLLIKPDKAEFLFDKIKLEPVSLEEVKITTEREMIESGIDKKVYNVGRDISSAGGTAADILQNVPSVTMDMDKNIQLRGSGSVHILINGRPSTLTGQGGLEQLPASMIEKIEVITNPSAKFDPDGMSGIINIITRNNTEKGWSGAISATAGTRHKYNPSLYLNYRTPKLNIYTNWSWQYNRNFQNSTFERRNFPGDTTFYINQNSDGYNINQAYTASLGLDFTPSPQLSLGASGLFALKKRDEISSLFYHFLDENQDTVQRQQRDNNQAGKPVSVESSLYLKRIFKTSDHYLMGELAFSSTGNIENLNATQYYPFGIILPDSFQHTRTDRINRVITPQLNYVKGFKNGKKLEAGVKAIVRHIDQDFFSENSGEGMNIWVPNLNISNRIIYDDRVLSAYTVFTGAIKSFGYSMGLRGEQTNYTVNQATLDSIYKNQYFNLFPTAALKYKFKNMHEAGFTYSRRINRPGIEQLNPFPEWRDPFNFMYGNPYLKPEYTHSLELSYRGFLKKTNFTGSLYFKQTDGAITRYRTVSENGVATTSYENITQTRQFGTELILQIEPFKWWNMNISFNGYYQVSNADNLLSGLSNEGFGGNIRYMGNLKFWKSASAQIIYNHMFPFVMPQGRGGPGQWLDIGLRKEFLKDNRLGITLRVTDIFNTRQFRMKSAGEEFEGTVRWKRESQIGYVGINYRFGNGKQPQPKKEIQEQPQGDPGF